MIYKITAVGNEGENAPRTWDSQYGQMITYYVMFEGMTQRVQIGQKISTPAPQVGAELDGTIDMSAQGGPKFKKTYNPQGGGFPSSNKGGGGRPQSDPRTMYMSYAKDIAVAVAGHLMDTTGFKEKDFDNIFDHIVSKVKEATPILQSEVDQKVEETFGGGEAINDSEVPKEFK